MKIALLGYGVRAITMAEDACALGAEVIAILEPNPPAAARAAAAFPDARVVAAFGELPLGDLDAAFVFSPDYVHEQQTIALLHAGVPTYVDKPLAISISGCDAVLAEAAHTGACVYVGHNMRHMPVIQTLRDVITSGRIGAVKTIWCRHFVGNGGDYYFKDWHADRRNVNSLLLQKGAHDIDVIHWLAGGYSRTVSAFGDLGVYGKIRSRRVPDAHQLMTDWLNLEEHWPPSALTGLNPVVDVEDLAVVNMRLDNGVLAAYQQCHYTPDYWRNYTVIGTEGRCENFGDQCGAVVRVWNRRHEYDPVGDEVITVPDEPGLHGGADRRIVAEFFDVLAGRVKPSIPIVAAREAVAAGCAATESMRAGGVLVDVPPPGAR